MRRSLTKDQFEAIEYLRDSGLNDSQINSKLKSMGKEPIDFSNLNIISDNAARQTIDQERVRMQAAGLESEPIPLYTPPSDAEAAGKTLQNLGKGAFKSVGEASVIAGSLFGFDKIPGIELDTIAEGLGKVQPTPGYEGAFTAGRVAPYAAGAAGAAAKAMPIAKSLFATASKSKVAALASKFFGSTGGQVSTALGVYEGGKAVKDTLTRGK